MNAVLEAPPAPPIKKAGWADLGLIDRTLRSIAEAGFETPSDIQRELIPHAVAGKDVIGQAKTGTGKTAAFTLPILQLVEPGVVAQALVLVPTRELALQVESHVKMLGAGSGLKTVSVLGGRKIREQVGALKSKPEIVIGTPGRVLDLIQRKELNLGSIKIAILDEVDRMLDIGFRDDIRRILKGMPGHPQTIFVSATIDDEIRKLAKTYMRDPVEVDVSRDVLTVENIEQGYISLDPRDKFQTLLNFLDHEKPTLAIVFTNTKHQARRVALNLKKHNVNCKEIHGDLIQAKREKVLDSFRKGQIHVLVATDLASRGIDVLEVSHIVNYDVPVDTAVYVHRVGRTARMGNKGYAVTFVASDQGKQLTDIEKLINRQLPQFDGEWRINRPLRRDEETPARADSQAAVPGAEGVPEASAQRLTEVFRRCEVLDAHGIEPQKRTLGSRFRSARKFRR